MDGHPDDDAGLRALLFSWGAITAELGGTWVEDSDSDGEKEILVGYVELPVQDPFSSLGEFLILDRSADRYQVVFQASTTPEHAGGVVGPGLLQVAHMTGDGVPEVVFTSLSCGAHTCFKGFHVVGWDGSGYRDLTAENLGGPFPQLTIADRDEDGIQELILHVGVIASVGAGPQRGYTEIHRWDGSQFILAESIFDPVACQYFLVLDANHALAEGNLERAIELYGQAVAATEEGDQCFWWREGSLQELPAFSRFRLVLAHLLQGDPDAAQARLEELEGEQPEDIYAQAGRLFWDRFTESGDVAHACAAVNRFAEDHPATWEILAEWGYANPSFTAREVCPFI